jgi:hypothetical protein
MKKITTLLVAILIAMIARADEGMWLPSLISQRIADMQEKGFKLSADDIYNINQASLKDAVVLFGRGCTGEIVSEEGLLLTNHHCGYGQIQKHSSVEHDYLRDGFWAMNRDEELPNKGLTVSILERMEDVTDVILKGCTPDMDVKEREKVIERNRFNLINKVVTPKSGMQARVEALYYGNQYYLFVYKVFSDVRLVGAPPSSIGKFGGDTDNWMWPRHTGDFSIFRIYADKNNNPAPYSKNNVPYKPKKYLNISTKGVKEGDFTMVFGFPGRTQEYIHSEGVRYTEQIGDPHKIRLRTLRLQIMDKYMKQSQKVRIQYSSKYAGVSNAWKKWQGEVKGLKKMKTVAVKQAYEAKFAQWAKGGEFDGITDSIAAIYRKAEPIMFAKDYYNETFKACELINYAPDACHIGGTDEILGSFIDTVGTRAEAREFFKDYDVRIDKEIFAAMMAEFDRNIPQEDQPEYFKEQMRKYGNAQTWADSLYAQSKFTSLESVYSLTDFVSNDPAIELFCKMQDWSMKLDAKIKAFNIELQEAYRDYMRGQMVYSRTQRIAKDFYPDANLTLRVAYGHVKGYSPADGTYYLPGSTIKGIIEKDNPDIFDYNIPQRLRDIYAQRDFGRWVNEDGEVPVCFLATNHTTGGNSGSPILDAEGNLIGLNFDRVWEGTMSDLVFDPEICRNIGLDIRYVLFIIEKIGGAGYLIDEMTLN